MNSNEKIAMPDAIKKDVELIVKIATMAKQFLLDLHIEIGSDQYRADLEALRPENEYEFATTLAFLKRLSPNEEHPDGLSELDINPTYLNRYPYIAAAGIIETSHKFIDLARKITSQPVITAVQCHNYALYYWRIKWLSEALSISEMFKEDYSKRQKKSASTPCTSQLNFIIRKILEENPSYTWKEVLKELENQKGKGIITDCTENSISWKKSNGSIVKSPISGIKDRVTGSNRTETHLCSCGDTYVNHRQNPSASTGARVGRWDEVLVGSGGAGTPGRLGWTWPVRGRVVGGSLRVASGAPNGGSA